MGLHKLPSDYTWDYKKKCRITLGITKKDRRITLGITKKDRRITLGITNPDYMRLYRITMRIYSDYIGIRFFYSGLRLST